LKAVTYLCEELESLNGLLLDEKTLNEVESILEQLSVVRSDLQEEFSRHRKRLKELEEQEQQLTELNNRLQSNRDVVQMDTGVHATAW